MEQDIVFDFENDLQEDARNDELSRKPAMPVGEIGQQPKNFVRNFKKVCCICLPVARMPSCLHTVCTMAVCMQNSRTAPNSCSSAASSVHNIRGM